MGEEVSSVRPVLSVGETLIDIIVNDGAPSLVEARDFVARAGGAPANVAVALSRLGVASAFCGVVGADPFGERLIAELRAENVDVSRIRQTTAAPTTIAFAWRDERGDGKFWIMRGADLELAPGDADRAGIAGLTALVLGSVSLAAASSRAAVLHAVALANRDGASLVHCLAGKDRTGMAVAVFHRLVGLHSDDVMEDYLLTNSVGDQDARIAAGAPSIRERYGEMSEGAMRVIMSVAPEYLENAFAAIDERFGSIDRFAEEQLGVDPARRDALKARYVAA